MAVLIRPFRRDKKQDFASAAEAEVLVRSAVGQVLGTAAASDFTQGELPWNTAFGSLLYLLRNRKNDATLQELARVHVVDALKRWEPRVRISTVQVSRGENVLAIRLRYDIVSSGGNVVVADVEQTVRV